MPIQYSDGPNPMPGTFNQADIVAISAVARGEANADQQRRALNAIVHQVCMWGDLSFRPDHLGGERATCFAEGKRFVASAILKAMNVPLHVWTGEAKRSRKRPNE